MTTTNQTTHKSNGHHPPVTPTDTVHVLLNDSVQKIAEGLVDQLKAVRDNTVALEAQLLACVAQTKASIDLLHTLGAQVADEAARGRKVCAELEEGIARIASDHP